MQKVTMQNIADALGISRITVWKALTNRPGISEKLRQQVMAKAEEMGYAPVAHAAVKPKTQHTFSIVVSRPESSAFWMQIIHHVAKELALHDINLMYTYMPTAFRPGYELPSSLETEAVDGFIVLNIYDESLLHMLADSPQPKVFLDTIPSLPAAGLKGDLMIIEGRSSVREITLRLLDGGWRRLGFVGDVNYAQTNLDRYQGFLDAHAARGLKPDAGCLLTGPLGVRTHGEEIYSFLDGLEALPQGVVCASDYVAHFVARYVEEHKDRAPAGFVVTGYDDSDEYGNIAGRITSVGVQTAFLGSRLARQALFLSDYPSATHEVSYVDAEVIFRGALQ